jgi:hypothetical protein
MVRVYSNDSAIGLLVDVRSWEEGHRIGHNDTAHWIEKTSRNCGRHEMGLLSISAQALRQRIASERLSNETVAGLEALRGRFLSPTALIGCSIFIPSMFP